jgi:DNA polymerase III alpha subunit
LGSSGLSQQQASTLWEQITAFAGFSLNQGHATAYADLSYRMAYVKAHWPAAFLCARLADWGGFHHQAIYIAEAQRLGIAVKPPHINHSRRKFTMQVVEANELEPMQGLGGAVLWMGLGQVRDLRRSAISNIVNERARGRFHSLRELMRRVPLHGKEVAHLIQCGALDGLGENRASLLAEAEMVGASGSASQLAFSFALPSLPADTAEERIAWERITLGQPVSVHPLEVVADCLPGHTALRLLPRMPLGKVTVAGVRLPGWTGGKGFFLGDGDSYITVDKEGAAHPPAWEPLLIRGEWRSDSWGTLWMRADSIDRVG